MVWDQERGGECVKEKVASVDSQVLQKEDRELHSIFKMAQGLSGQG